MPELVDNAWEHRTREPWKRFVARKRAERATVRCQAPTDACPTCGAPTSARVPLIGPKQVIVNVAWKHGISAEALTSSSRRHSIVHARQEAMWALRQLRKHNGAQRFSYPAIASLVGRADHTTALHGVRAHAARMEAEG